MLTDFDLLREWADGEDPDQIADAIMAGDWWQRAAAAVLGTGGHHHCGYGGPDTNAPGFDRLTTPQMYGQRLRFGDVDDVDERRRQRREHHAWWRDFRREQLDGDHDHMPF